MYYLYSTAAEQRYEGQTAILIYNKLNHRTKHANCLGQLESEDLYSFNQDPQKITTIYLFDRAPPRIIDTTPLFLYGKNCWTTSSDCSCELKLWTYACPLWHSQKRDVRVQVVKNKHFHFWSLCCHEDLICYNEHSGVECLTQRYFMKNLGCGI